MKSLFDKVSVQTSRLVTRKYSTSFTLGIQGLDKKFHDPIYSIYGFVRFADEIVDSFHDYPKAELLKRFRQDTYLAIEERISLNPVLNSFQEVYHKYGIDRNLVDAFLDSMEMDLHKVDYDRVQYERYILGSAEVVGLMCLRVFVEGDQEKYDELVDPAMKLGSAFQKINFLRDLSLDFHQLGRVYFPNLDMDGFDHDSKKKIEEEIENDFHLGFQGIKALPKGARFGVYIAYVYYYSLFQKIKRTPFNHLFRERIRIPNKKKYGLFLSSYLRHSFNLL